MAGNFTILSLPSDRGTFPTGITNVAAKTTALILEADIQYYQKYC